MLCAHASGKSLCFLHVLPVVKAYIKIAAGRSVSSWATMPTHFRVHYDEPSALEISEVDGCCRMAGTDGRWRACRWPSLSELALLKDVLPLEFDGRTARRHQGRSAGQHSCLALTNRGPASTGM